MSFRASRHDVAKCRFQYKIRLGVKGQWRGVGEHALRGLYRGKKPLAFRSAKKNLFCTVVTFYPDRHSVVVLWSLVVHP